MILLSLLTIGTSFWYDSLTDLNLVLRNYLMGLLRVFPSTFFVVLGYGIKDKIKQWVELKIGIRIIILIVLVCLQAVMCFFCNDSIDVQVFRLGTQWFYFPKAIVGTFAVLLLSQMIHGKWLVYLGNKTKELMILHYPPFYWTVVLRFILGKIFQPNIIGGLIITAVTVVGCVAIDWIMNRFKIWNFVMGNKNNML